MADALPRVGAIGFAIRNTVVDPDTEEPVDLSTSTSLQLVIVKPDGTRVAKTPLLTTDGTDGKVHYLTASGDFNLEGVYQMQVNVTGSGTYLPSDIETFRVRGVL